MRVFTALWPPPHVLDHLDLALAGVRGRPASAGGELRWSARETWHLTTAFYGSVPDGLADAAGSPSGRPADAPGGLVDTLARALVGLAPYDLRLRGAGVFARRTVWIGVGGDVERHRELTRACVDAGADVAAPPDTRVRERAHLTVARVRPGQGPPRRGGSRPHRGGRPGSSTDRLQDDPAAALARALAVYEGPTWTVEDVLLVSSRPGEGRGGGPLYTPVARVPLRG
ncbi:2'-5' RNA ligase family protein [Cellulomonas gilvus]|uniref:RNA 2',3'-cyclic phosphodiesterase n=1 Tax=Cellulomonas gilvus (strain ATCC 13127 / NRRL B-14078) TaxID=593907 RepID=F7ZZ48_CELGA|nr:2'-5' RNA ligase family protein [Cellulomonas gilvus]AEI12464.1 2'-5' RNA ligase [Cellulomonas gilvus ATCC 13127]